MDNGQKLTFTYLNLVGGRLPYFQSVRSYHKLYVPYIQIGLNFLCRNKHFRLKKIFWIVAIGPVQIQPRPPIVMSRNTPTRPVTSPAVVDFTRQTSPATPANKSKPFPALAMQPKPQKAPPAGNSRRSGTKLYCLIQVPSSIGEVDYSETLARLNF